jgi:hypothetical protein
MSRITLTPNHPGFPKILAIVVFALSLTVSIFVHQGDTIKHVITSDAKAYYEYLPATFIDQDIKHMHWAIHLDNGNKLNLCQMGVAILELPFFAAAHVGAKIFGLKANGYSPIYQWSILLAACTYGALAIYILFLALRRSFTSRIAFIAILFVYLGTNLFYYTSFEGGMSHIFSFFMFACLMYFTPVFIERPTARNAIIFGLICGMIGLIRLNNMAVGLYAFLYAVISWESFKARMRFFFVENRAAVAIVTVTIVVLFIPQVAYWKAVSGHFVVFTYGETGQGFNWGNPELWNVLFSPQNGWIIYSPIMLIAVIGMFWGMAKKEKNYAVIFIVWLLAWYVFASWWCWWFGGAYGHRAFVEYYALLLIPFAYLITKIQASKYKIVIYTVCAYLVFINLRMCFNYANPWDGPDWHWDDYFHVLKQAILIG